MKINLLRPCALGVTLCFGIAVVAPMAGAAPKSKTRVSRLEIWPGQRTLVVLPIMVSEDFLTTGGTVVAPPTTTPAEPDNTTATPATPVATGGGSALASALGPLLAPQLSDALRATGKFSITRPYKFDPILRRAVTEGLDEATANAFIEAPSLSTAQTLLPLLRLEQPGMVAQVLIQSLRVGGTPAAPTVQLSVRGDLYQADSAGPFRTITVTSRPFGGATPEDRLRAAAGQAFGDIAAAFVEPPAEFDLPLPTASSAGMMTGTTPGGTSMPGMNDLPAQPGGGDSTATPVMPAPTNPAPVNPVTPQTPNSTTGGPIAPQLPGATPPLGVNVPEE